MVRIPRLDRARVFGRVTAPEILTRLTGLHVGLSVSNGQVKARMTRPGLPIPDEARTLIRQVKPYLTKGDPACPACRRVEAPCAGHYWHPVRGLDSRPAGG